MIAFFRTWTFWIAVCTWLVLMGGHYATILPPPYGLVLANAVALVYGVLRCLQKRRAGIPWKGILFTSEFGVTAATVGMNFLESLSKLPSLPPKALAGISGGVMVLGSLLHTLSSTRKALPPVDVILKNLEKDNLASGVPDKHADSTETPTVIASIHNEPTSPNPIDDSKLTTWCEYSLLDYKGKAPKTLCLVPSWSEDEFLEFLVDRKVVNSKETTMIRVLQRDEKGMARVFQAVDVSGEAITFVYSKEMGSWKP